MLDWNKYFIRICCNLIKSLITIIIFALQKNINHRLRTQPKPIINESKISIYIAVRASCQNKFWLLFGSPYLATNFNSMSSELFSQLVNIKERLSNLLFAVFFYNKSQYYVISMGLCPCLQKDMPFIGRDITYY